jgi:hypothetical protein
VREITVTILGTTGVTDVTQKQQRDLEASVRASLENHAGKTVQRSRPRGAEAMDANPKLNHARDFSTAILDKLLILGHISRVLYIA